MTFFISAKGSHYIQKTTSNFFLVQCWSFPDSFRVVFRALSIVLTFFSRSFEAAIDSLKYIQKLTETKRFSLVKDLQALIKETKAMMTGDDDEESSVEVQCS